jgi:hypothetical protein
MNSLINILFYVLNLLNNLLEPFIVINLLNSGGNNLNVLPFRDQISLFNSEIYLRVLRGFLFYLIELLVIN